MQQQTVIIKRVIQLTAEKVNELVPAWNNPMLGVESNKGFHIAHLHHHAELKASINVEVNAKVDMLRGTTNNRLNFIAIR